MVERAAATVRACELEPAVCKSCYLTPATSKQSEAYRAEEINRAFADDAIAGLIALKAGSGTLALLSHLDYDLICRHPKPVLGFSDITGLHLALQGLCNFVSFYGPVAMTNIFAARSDGAAVESYTVRSLQRALFDPRPIGRFINPPGEEIECLWAGTGRGKLVGGNLSVIVKTLGSAYAINTENRILFIEDYGETIADIRAMLQALLRAGKISSCRGVVLGTWIRCGEEYESPVVRKRRFDEMVHDVLGPCAKPIIANIRAGHCMPMATLPLGVEVEIDADAKTLMFIEPATCE
jgi:muramoyltetrapeptide carboxypeptidase